MERRNPRTALRFRKVFGVIWTVWSGASGAASCGWLMAATHITPCACELHGRLRQCCVVGPDHVGHICIVYVLNPSGMVPQEVLTRPGLRTGVLSASGMLGAALALRCAVHAAGPVPWQRQPPDHDSHAPPAWAAVWQLQHLCLVVARTNSVFRVSLHSAHFSVLAIARVMTGQSCAACCATAPGWTAAVVSFCSGSTWCGNVCLFAHTQRFCVRG